MLKTKLLRFLKRNPQQKILVVLLLGLTIYLLLNRVGNLFGGPNIYEQSALEALKNFNPISGAQNDIMYFSVAKILSFIFSELDALRVASAVFGLISILNIRFVLKHWAASRVANLGVIIVASSFWFLVMARSGHPIIMPTLWLSAILATYVWSKFTTKQLLAKIFLTVSTALSLYTPLFVWTLTVLAIIYVTLKKPKQAIKNSNVKYFAIWLLIIIPLIYSILASNTSVYDLIGTDKLPSLNPIVFMGNILTNIGHLSFNGPLSASINLEDSPLLDFFQTAFLILGTITVVRAKDKLKLGVLIIYPIVIITLLSFNEQLLPAMLLVLPVIFISIMIGLIEFIGMWLKAFPKNPVGRLVGVIVCSALVGMSSYYNVHKYFTVWPNNPNTIEAHKLN